MTSTPHPQRPRSAATLRPDPNPEDVAAWLDELTDVLDALEARAAEAEERGEPGHEVEWLHVRTSAVRDRVRALAPPDAA